MFEKVFEKRSSEPFNWTEWVSGDKNPYLNEKVDSTYSKAINILSDTVAKLPIDIKKVSENGEITDNNHRLYDLLRIRPNEIMNSFIGLKSLIMLYKHYGMAGLFINTDKKGKVIGLYPAKVTQITVDNMGIIKSSKIHKTLIDFEVGDYSGSCFNDDIILLLDNSLNGIEGKATKHYARYSINTNIKAQEYQQDLFSNGLTNKAAVQLTSDIKDEKELGKIQAKFNRIYSSKGRIFTLPAGYSITPLNLNLADSQFAQLKAMGKQDIASAIGVPYSLIEKGVLTEDENIGYLTNTIIPILVQLEQELDWKLLSLSERKQGYKIRFNVNTMLRTSPEKQKNIIIDYVKNGVYSIEYARQILGVPNDMNGTVLLPSGEILLEDLINHNASWQKGTKGGEDNGEGDKTN